jgi:stearoyl-CoA desaturase (delta-9 desaturase)
LVGRFPSESVAALLRIPHRATEAMTALILPYIPSREEFSAEAKAMFAISASLNEIVDRAYALVLASVGMRLTSSDVRCS